MEFEDKRNLSNVRLEHAFECLSSAKLNFEANGYKTAANRSYYAVFHAMRAVLAYDGIDMKHHSGIISEFRRLYIKTGVFPKEMSETISALFDIRSDSDYDDYYVISIEDVKTQMGNAEHFLDKVSLFLQNKGMPAE